MYLDYIYVYIFDPRENRTVAKAQINKTPDLTNIKNFKNSNPVMLVDFKIYSKYQRYQLSVPMLKKLIQMFNINCTAVDNDAEVAVHVLTQAGFKIIDDNYTNYLNFDQRQLFMTI